MSIAEKLTTIAENEQKVYDAGKKSQYDEFWDNYQYYGSRKHYKYGFAGVGWNKETFKPKYKITLEGTLGNDMFEYFGVEAKSVEDMFDYRLVKDMIDFSQATSASGVFEDAAINYIDVDFSKATTLRTCFRYTMRANYVTHIRLKVSELCTNYEVAFQNADKLTHLFFAEGSVIGANLSLSYSKSLVYESIMSVINALKDYSGTSTTRTLTLHADAKLRLNESDMAIARQKGWDIV